MTGPTGADQQTPGGLTDWEQIEADQRRLYDERQIERANIDPELAEQVARIERERLGHEPPEPPPPGRAVR